MVLKCGNSSVGRARPCQGRGREFESRFPLKKVRIGGRSLLVILVRTAVREDNESDIKKVPRQRLRS